MDRIFLERVADLPKSTAQGTYANFESMHAETLSMNPHRTVVDHEQAEESQVNQLTIALKQQND